MENYGTLTGTFTSTDGIHRIRYYGFQPSRTPRAIVQICHGMCDYTERYQPLIDALTGAGYLVFSHNHLGHKGSVIDDKELGYFGEKDGWKYLVMDTAKLTKHLRRCFSSLPIFLLGHSMGSFLSRIYLFHYSQLIDGLILLGTSGHKWETQPGRLLIRLVRRIEGSRARSQLLYLITFGSYGKLIERPQTLYDWISTNRPTINRFATDPYCTFIFTNAGMMDLTRILAICSSPVWYRHYPKSLPLLLASGSEDPVGQFGKGVTEVYHKLCARKVTPLTLKLYTGERHELFTGNTRQDFFSDLLQWLDATLTTLNP